MSSRTRRSLVITSALAAVALAVSACGGSSDDTASSQSSAPTSAGAASPAAARRSSSTSPRAEPGHAPPKVDTIAAEGAAGDPDRGTLLVTGSAGTAPPLRFYATDDTTLIGSEVDFAYLIGDVLGLEVEISTADWAQNFVRIDSGEVDAFISNVTVTEERKEKYDFATYRLDTLALETQQDTDWTVNGPEDLAGKIVAVGSGTNQEKILVDWNDAEHRQGSGTDRHQVLPELDRLLPGALVGSDRRVFRAEPDRAVPRRQHRREQGDRHLLRCRRCPAGRDRRADQKGQRLGQGIRRCAEPHHRERHLPAGDRPLEPGQRDGAGRPRSIRPGLPKTTS